MNKQLNYIFIGGAGRSGTTLVQKILLGHPEIAGGPELRFTRPIFELLEQMLQALELKHFHVAIKREHLENTIMKMYDDLLKVYDDGQVSYISEKTPSNIVVANILLETYKQAFFVNVYRDGRAVLNSHLNVKRRAKSKGKNLTEIGLIRTAVYWNQCVTEGIQVQKEHPNRVICVKYENLLLNTERVLKELCEKINLDIYPPMLEPEKIKLQEGVSKPHINNIWYTEEMYRKGLDLSGLDSWKRELNFMQKFIAASIMYKGLKELQYEVRPSHKYANIIFFFFYDIKKTIKSVRFFYPLLYLKRKLF